MSEPVTTKLHSNSLASLAYEEILKNIADGVYEADMRLVIDDIARQFGTSLIPVREALARLHAQRLVNYEKNKGYRVAPTPDLNDYKEIFEARLMIEYSAMEFGVKRTTTKHVQQLRLLNDKLRKLKLGKTFEGYRKFILLNDEFHNLLVSISGNSIIEQAYKDISYGLITSRGLYGIGITDLKQDVAEHDRIIEALDKRDYTSVKKAVKHHITEGLARYTAVVFGKHS